MNLKLLKIESSELHFGLLEKCVPYEEVIGNLFIYEVYKPPSIGESSELGSYQVVIESKAENHEQLEDRNCEAISLAEKIELLWSYVWITPLHRKTRGVMLDIFKPPKGWSSNKENIKREMDIEKGGLTFGSISFGRNEYTYSKMLPLKRALRIRSNYLKADPIIQTLIDFHFEGHCARSTHSNLFLLSKGLEITRAFLPGKTDDEKESNLPEEVQNELKNSYHNLFNLANNRKNARHAVKRKEAPIELLPEMKDRELADFIHDCDLIIRAVVCNYFDEDVVISKKRNA